MRTINRRSVIIGTAFAASAPKLVKADSLFGIEGDAFSLQGMRSAVHWAHEKAIEQPGMRLCFSNGHKHEWCYYQYLGRADTVAVVSADGSAIKHKKGYAYATHLEVAITDRNGHRTIQVLPIDYEVAMKFTPKAYREHMPPKPLF